MYHHSFGSIMYQGRGVVRMRGRRGRGRAWAWAGREGVNYSRVQHGQPAV